MLENIIAWSVRHRVLVLIGMLVVVGLGVDAMRRLPIDAVPDVTNVQVQVLTSAPALGPEEVEKFITTPVEQSMSGLPGMNEVRSTSQFGLSAVTIVFDDGTDIYFARQLVNERLQEARGAIPEGYGDPEMGPISTGLGEIYQFEVKGANKTPMELRTILEWEIAPRLRRVAGVIEVNSFGGELKTYEVQIRPEDVVRFGVSIDEVMDALKKNNANAGGAYLQRNGEQYVIRGEGLIASLEDIGSVVVKVDEDLGEGTPIFVRQVANVRLAPMVRQGAVTRDGRGEVVTGIAMMLMGANSREVVTAVKEEVERLRPALAKLGVEIEPFYDRTALVEKTVHTVSRSLIEGGILVIVVLFIMLRNLRAGLVVASIIPLAMLAAFIGMVRLGVSGNLMSLGALDFGLIVDGAVILIENSMRLIAERSHEHGRPLTSEERSQVVVEASADVRRATLFGVIIIAVVYLPILALVGIEGKMFRPMAITVLLALASAMVMAFTFVPALASIVLPRKLSEKDSFLVSGARKAYEPALARAMRYPWITVSLVVGALAGTVVVASRLGAEFVPTLDEGSIAIQAWRPTSVSLEESIRQTTELEKVLKEFPEVITVVSKTGRAEIATDPMGVDTSDVFVMLKPQDEWTTGHDRKELIEKLDERLQARLPGTVLSYSQPIELRVSELISGVKAQVAIKIFGDDLSALERIANSVVSVMEDIPGAADVKAERLAGLPVLRVIVDREAISRFGINAADVLDVVSALGGRNVGVVLEGARRFSLQVRIAPDARQNVDAVKRLLVRAPGGQRVPLEQLADIRVEEGPAQVSHEQGRRRVSVEMNVRGRDLASFVAEAQRRLEASNAVPPGYFVEWGGQFENLKTASKRLAIVVPVALALILVLLYMSFASTGLAFLIFVSVPSAVMGGIVALSIRDLPLSISAAVGFIALFGVAVLNGLVLVGAIQQARIGGATAFEAAKQAARLRLRPVLTTGLVASLGFVPMAIANGAGAEVQRPLATVVIGGLISATLLTLLVLPTLYAWVFGRGERRAALAVARVTSAPTEPAPPEPPSEPIPLPPSDPSPPTDPVASSDDIPKEDA